MSESLSTQSKASILAIGTELTTGQITNRNAAWISEQLVHLGIEVVLHETVSDDREQILDALTHCAQHSQFLFITGGLGPTSDDFTREVIAQWLEKPLEFSPATWEKVVQRLLRLGIPHEKMAQSNRQQCFFPQGSKILDNPQGTAAGFTAPIAHQALHSQEQWIWVLPGPPHEVAAVWAQGIEKQLLEIHPHLEKSTLFRWQCLGKSEADLGEITEKALSGSRLKTGYRVHRPFVEVKVWCPEKEVTQVQKWLQALDRALAPWVMTRNDEDLADQLLLKLQGFSEIQILDYGTGGLLAARLGSQLKKPEHQAILDQISLLTQWNESRDPQTQAESQPPTESDCLTLIFSGFQENGDCAVGFHWGNQHLHQKIENPYRSKEFFERTRHFALEMALKIWADWVRQTSI